MNSSICSLSLPQSDIDSFLLPLISYCTGNVVFALLPPIFPSPFYLSAIWLLASPFWKQWKSRSHFLKPRGPSLVGLKINLSVIFKMFPCTLKHPYACLGWPGHVLLSHFSLFSLFSPLPQLPCCQSFVIHDRASFLSPNSLDSLAPHLIFPGIAKKLTTSVKSRGMEEASVWVWTFFHFYSSISLNSSSLYPTSMPFWGPPTCEELCCVLLMTRMLIPHGLCLYRAPQLKGVGEVEVAELMLWLPGGKAILWEHHERGSRLGDDPWWELRE